MMQAAQNRGKKLAVMALAALAAAVMVLEFSGTEEDAPIAVSPPPEVTAPAGTRPFLTQAPVPEFADETARPAPGYDPVACAACEKKHVASGDCEPDSGCDGLAGDDKRLCEDLVACQRRTSCWVKHPLDCLCGSAPGVACAQGAANGACRAEIQAATRTTDPVRNGTLFFDPALPAGRANRLIACAFDNCKSVCAPEIAQNQVPPGAAAQN
jgi:hypothetical protein